MDILYVLNKNDIKYTLVNGNIILKDAVLDLHNCDITGVLDVSRISNLKDLCCSNNQITEIILNSNIEKLECNYNKISELVLTRNIKRCYCFNNRLTNLILNENLRICICNDNNLTHISLNANLRSLFCRNNNLSYIEINDNLNLFDGEYNPLPSYFFENNSLDNIRNIQQAEKRCENIKTFLEETC